MLHVYTPENASSKYMGSLTLRIPATRVKNLTSLGNSRHLCGLSPSNAETISVMALLVWVSNTLTPGKEESVETRR